MPVARWMKGEGARFAAPDAGGGGTGGLGQSCLVIACMLSASSVPVLDLEERRGRGRTRGMSQQA